MITVLPSRERAISPWWRASAVLLRAAAGLAWRAMIAPGQPSRIDRSTGRVRGR